MRARSHKYPDSDDEKYIDTTYYDENQQYLDLGFQRLKKLDTFKYPEFTYLHKLFVDHNNLEMLPDSKYLPNLVYLTCAWNNLKNIPFYPNLVFLNIAGNKIRSCLEYQKSNIIYFDCSYNLGFCPDFNLPNCEQLYINDTELESIDLDFFPKLSILDCSNNKLINILGGNNLVEINIQYNNIKKLPNWPELIRLMADHNQIVTLSTYPKMISLNISYNNLVKINDQPILKKIIANNNVIEIIGNMPKLELIDLSHNNIINYNIPAKAEYVSLQFNPLTNIILDEKVLKSIKELQINFETYKHIYSTYYQNIDAINILTNEEKLEQLLKKLDNILSKSISRYVFRRFKEIKFKEREMELLKITCKIYSKFFPIDRNITLEELFNIKEFHHLLKCITKFYYKTIVITLYFNGYL